MDGVSKSVEQQLGGALDGKKFGRAFGKDFGAGLKSSAADVDRLALSYTKLRDRASDALGKVRTEEAALKRLRDTGASDDRIIRSEERLATARRNSSRAAREASDGHKVLQQAQSASVATSAAAGGAFGKLSALAAGSGAALASAGAIAGGVALAGIAALAAGVLVAGNRLYELGAQFDNTFDNIRIKTGATGPALQQLEDATKRLSTNVPLSIGEIGNVVAETSRALHLVGPDLENVAGHIANLGRLTGEPVNVRELGKAFRGFGVDAKDQVPALDGLFRASQSTGVGVNELLATVVKGGAGLRQFGFDFGQSAALVTQFEAAGLNADKAMTGLTKGLASLAKNGQTGKQALQDSVTQIKALIAAGNDAGALELTNKLFGAKGGVQFFEAIKNGALDLDTLASSISNTGDTIDKAAKDTDDWKERWQQFKNQIAVSLQPIATGLFDSVNESLTHLADWISAHQAEVVGFFEGFGNIVITAAEHVAHGAGGMLQAIGDLVGGIGNVKGVLDNTMAFFADLRGDHAAADEFRRSAQEAFGWGENIRAAGDKLANLDLRGARDKLSGWAGAAREAAQNAQGAGGAVTGLATALGALPFNKVIGVDVNVDPTHAQAVIDDFFRRNENRTLPVAVNPNIPATTPGRNPLDLLPGPGRAAGGMISGFSTTDDRLGLVAGHGLIGLAGGEGIVKASATRKLGGKPFIDFLNGFAGGGVVPPDVAAAQALVGTGYSQANRTDCSGTVARVINQALGMGGGLMSTKTAKEWLAERGFVPGSGGPGQITVGWYDHGPNPNDGHMAMTLSDGSPAESGGSVGVFTVGAGAKGADDPQFDQHMFLPTVYGEGPAGSSSASPFAGGSAAAAMTGAPPPTSSGGGTPPSSSSGGGGGGFNLPSSISGLATWPFDTMTSAGEANSGPGHRDPNAYFPKAASAAVGGQIESALGVFGVNGTPGWLKAASQLIGGISIGGGPSAAPIAANPMAHAGGGEPPGPGNDGQQQAQTVNNWTINARDTEDAFIRAQRKERERSAAKLSRF